MCIPTILLERSKNSSILVNIRSMFGYFASTLGYIESTLEYFGCTLEYIGNTLGCFGSDGSILGYVGSALADIAFESILVNIMSSSGVF